MPGSFAELVGVVEQLHDEVKGLRKDLVPRSQLRRQWKQAAVIVVLAALVTLTAENSALSACFLSPPKAGSVGRTTCGIAFPGYGPAMTQGDERLARFLEVLAEVPRNRQRVAGLERRVHQLEAELAKLKE